jgi:uncharacterized protein YyaL (SSP411 family)
MDWQSLDVDTFARAAQEERLVLLSVGAVWCHWCHVMDEETWEDPAIEARLEAHYLAVRVDQDARPDVSERYERWGWPATVILRADGTELAKLRGFLPPERIGPLLDAFVADPTPGPSAFGEPMVPADRAERFARWDGAWDEVAGGWGRNTKYLDGPSFLLAMTLGEEARLAQARQIATLQRQLIDPAWGGAYQYSDSGDWLHPHFEKITSIQADDLRAFALAWARWGEPADRDAALSIAAYLELFLWDPAGGYRTSQDADLVPGEHSAAYFALGDVDRRALGVPRVDPHRYASDNGLLIAALADAGAWLRESTLVARAARAADWTIRARGLSGGGFSHDARDDGGPWLADTLAMGEGFAALHDATGEPKWLARSVAAVRFTERRFQAADGYRASARVESIPGLAPLRSGEDNARLALLADRVAERTGDASFRGVAAHALAFAVASDAAPAPVLRAELAVEREGLRVALVGPPDAALVEAARGLPVVDRRVLRGDPSDYPPAQVPTAYVCAGGTCSQPVTDPAALAAVALSR